MASSLAEIRSSIRVRWNDEIRGGHLLDTQYDNQNFTPPVDNLWCRLSIRFGVSRQISFSATVSRFRYPGVIIAQLFLPIGLGDGLLTEMADNINDSFRSKDAGGVIYWTPYINSIGVFEGFWQENVTIPFQADIAA